MAQAKNGFDHGFVSYRATPLQGMSKTLINRSQSKDMIEITKVVMDYRQLHPEYGYRRIAAATGVRPGAARRVMEMAIRRGTWRQQTHATITLNIQCNDPKQVVNEGFLDHVGWRNLCKVAEDELKYLVGVNNITITVISKVRI